MTLRQAVIMICPFIVFLARPVHAQTTTREKRFYANSINNAIATINEKERGIFQGREYTQYYKTKGNDGHPFFSNTQPDFIVYEGIKYQQVNFVYDTHMDELVVAHPDSSWITIDKAKVSTFAMGGHIFEKIEYRKDIPSGFYETLFKGDTVTFVAKWSKLFQASAWKEKVDFFLLSNRVYAVNNKKQLLKLFANKESQLRPFMKNAKLNFRKGKSKSFTEVVKFYYSLK